MGWVGSKLRFADQIREHFPPLVKSYAEPFAGSGSQFLRMIEVGQIAPGAKVAIAEVPAVANLWRCVADKDTRPRLVNRLRNWADDTKTVTQIDADDPLLAFDVAKDRVNSDWQRNYVGPHIGAAAAVLVLNHLCFNKLWRVNRSGEFNTSRNPKKKWDPRPSIARIERVAEALQNQGYDADWLNGDLEQRERERVMSKTREGKLRFLVATDVAARGIDISHLTHVINADFPENPESYVHRTGRTGRAGRTGTAILFYALWAMVTKR